MLMRGLAGAAVLLASAGCVNAGATAGADAGPKTCRQILVAGSNVTQTVCDTAEGWRDYDRTREREAQALVRRMQGFGG